MMDNSLAKHLAPEGGQFEYDGDTWSWQKATEGQINDFHRRALVLKIWKRQLDSPDMRGGKETNQLRSQFMEIENALAADLLDVGMLGCTWPDVSIQIIDMAAGGRKPDPRGGASNMRLEIN